ncbi:MAG: PhzF family phenazine biosynthesis protein [Halioglobus sp.]|nr:PhzF family phenazine biosynthesis protein [Halioglobus sp.]
MATVEPENGTPPSRGPHLLRAFAGPCAQGNPCLVTVLEAPPRRPPAEVDVTQCLCWPLGPRTAGVRCWSASGMEIQCCGHGLLSCAQLWRTAWPGGGALRMGSADIPVQYEDDRIWLGFAPLTVEVCDVPDWSVARFGGTPVAAAAAGGARGYIVLQWPDGGSLKMLEAPGYDLAGDTGCAVIATCRDRAAGPGAIRLRYFAPQHGVPEDTATGSAMRVLATFWHSQEMMTDLCARQDSPVGGELFSRVDGDTIWVGGRAGEA